VLRVRLSDLYQGQTGAPHLAFKIMKPFEKDKWDGEMFIKSIVLYSFLYFAGIASSLLAVQFPPSFENTLSDKSTKNEMYFGQVVNRSIKSDRLPMQHKTGRANKKSDIEVPTSIAPNLSIDVKCEPFNSPAHFIRDVIGRCFADAGQISYV
jgi:hypothetical protein